MKKAVTCLITAAVLCVGQAPVVRAESNPSTIPQPIVITEIQTGSVSDATAEFVELYNPNDTSVDVTGWQLQYRAATNTAAQAWLASSTKATISCTTGSAADCTVQIAPQSRLVLVHNIANIVDALPMSGGFSNSGGEIRLVQPGTTPIVQDFVGYGTAADSEGSPAAAPSAGHTLKRVVDANGVPIDTNNNSVDFIADCGDPSPGVEDQTPLPYATGCAAPQTSSTASDTGSTATSSSHSSASDTTQDSVSLTYLPIWITEVLPDPAPPQTDNLDEFIELYNPNDATVSLKGYTIQTGADWRYHFTLGDTPLGPHDYYAVRSAVSKLSLSNTGSGVRLIDPSGLVVSEAPSYGEAKQGQAWMFTGSTWVWSLTPTPNASNILTVPAPHTTNTLTTGTVPKKKAIAKITTKATKTTTKLTAPKITKATKKVASATPPANQIAALPPTPQYWLLVPIGAIAGGYAIYEYRQEISRTGQKVWKRLRGKTVEQPLLGNNPEDFV